MKKFLILTSIITTLLAFSLFGCNQNDDQTKNPPPVTPPIDTAQYIDGMKFDLLSDDTYYLVTVGSNLSSEIEIPDTCNGKSVTQIGLNAFYGCKTLTSITIPNTINHIGNNAFKNCTNLKTVIFNDNSSLITLPPVFNGCSSLEELDFGSNSSLEVIESQAFVGCSHLKNLTLPNSLLKIGKKAFYGCSAIEKIEIPSSLKTIETWAFENCLALSTITVKSGNSTFTSRDNVLFSDNMKTLVKYPSGKINTSYTIPSSVTTISDSAFSNARTLEEVTLPSSLKTIGNSAFISCLKLKGITIPSSVTTLSESAFQNCTSIKFVKFEAGSKLAKIEKFAFSSCTSLEEVDFGNTTTLINIGQDSFHYCEKLTSITIPDSVERIDGFAFEYCGLKTVIFGKNSKLTSLGTNVFTFCESLNNVVLPKSLTKIEVYVFDFCYSLTNLGYDGTVEEWNKIQKGAVWRDSAPFSYVQCTNGRA